MRESYKIIRKLREDNHLTQLDVANYLDMPRATYNHYELGKTDLTEEMIIKLAKLYHTTPNVILNFSTKSKNYNTDFLKLYKKIKYSDITVDYLLDIIELNEKYKKYEKSTWHLSFSVVK